MSIQGFNYGDIIHKYDYNALDNLPPEVTEEQIAQIEKNKNDIAELPEQIKQGIEDYFEENPISENYIDEDGNLVLDGEYGNSGVSEEQIAQAVEEYFEENPVTEVIAKLADVNLVNPDLCHVNKTWNGTNNITPLSDDTAVKYSAKYVLTPEIKCEPGEIYTVSQKGYLQNFFGAGQNGLFNVDFNKTFEKTFTIPNGVYSFRWRFTIPSENDENWKNSFMLVKGDTLPPTFVPYGEKVATLKETVQIPQLKDYVTNKDLENYPTNDDLANTLLPVIIKPKNDISTIANREKAIIVITFDNMPDDENSFNTICPYLKERNIPFTVFTDGSDDNNVIARYKQIKTYGGEVQLYNSQPASTYQGTSNYLEQYTQFKTAYDLFMKMGLPKPEFVAYSGGAYTSITEDIAKQFGFKWGRTTGGAGEANVSSYNDDYYALTALPLSGNTFDGTVESYSPLPESDVQYKMIRSFVFHKLLSDTVTDTSYNISWENLKQFIDSNYEIAQTANTIQFMSVSQLYEMCLFPTAEVGQHCIRYDARDGKQHEWVKIEDGWKEITN